MARIHSLNMTGADVVIALADGNPGATVVMAQMFKQGAEIDPDSSLGGLGAVLSLDTHKIYGPRIWMLYKDVCGQDIRIMLAILRAVQLGYLSESALNRAIDLPRRDADRGIDVPALVAKVEARLTRFQKAPVAPETTPVTEPPMMSHTDYLNSQTTEDDTTTGDLITDAVIVAEAVSELFSSNDTPDTPDTPSSDFGGFDGGESGGGGASGDY